MLTVFLILALIVAVVAVIFALQNTIPISVAFMVWRWDQSLALILLIAIAAGVIIGLLTILPSVIRNKIQLSSRKKKIDSLEKSLQEARQKIEAQTALIADMGKPAPVVETVETAPDPAPDQSTPQ